MEPRHAWPLLLAATLICAGCTSSTDAPSATQYRQTAGPKGQQSVAGSKLPTGADPVNLDPANFSADITNPYWPMKPGTRWTYRSVDADGEPPGHRHRRHHGHQEAGQRRHGRVVRDTARSEGRDHRGHLDWYAQDSEGNVWYMGEDTAEFEKGKIVSRAGSWEAGADGAAAGHPAARPAAGRPEVPPGVQEGRGRGQRRGARHHPSGRGGGRTLTRTRWSPWTPAASSRTVVEYKFYAPGISGRCSPWTYPAVLPVRSWSRSTRPLQSPAPGRSASPIRDLLRMFGYGSPSIIVKSLMVCES